MNQKQYKHLTQEESDFINEVGEQAAGILYRDYIHIFPLSEDTDFGEKDVVIEECLQEAFDSEIMRIKHPNVSWKPVMAIAINMATSGFLNQLLADDPDYLLKRYDHRI